MVRRFFYNICKKAALCIPQIKRHVEYTRWLEELISCGTDMRNADAERLKKEISLRAATEGGSRSGEFWEKNYRDGGTSGRGSYNHLADFKARVVNGLIEDFRVQSLIDLGCGDGNLLSMLKVSKYTGVDVSETIINRHLKQYADDENKTFYTVVERDDYINKKYDASLSMDVIFHLLEDDVFKRYIEDLFSLSSGIVIIYSSNHESYTKWMEYRHRNFTHLVATRMPEFRLVKYIPNEYPYIIGQNEAETSAADFYIYQKA
jgi:SAM-dependent methyltransferase